MDDVLDLFAEDEEDVRDPKDPTPRLVPWVETHRDVLDHALALARRVRDREQRIGAKALFEVLRWDCLLGLRIHLRSEEAGDGERYRLSNDMTAPCGRLLLLQDPTLEGVVRIKRAKWDWSRVLPEAMRVWEDRP